MSTSDLRSPLASTAMPERLVYTQCWEDPDVLLEAFAPVRGADVLCIASGGDLAIALGLAGAKSITAIDLSRPQLALTELKLAAGALSFEEMSALLGLAPSVDRVRLYERVRDRLSPESRSFWNRNARLIDEGMFLGGHMERWAARFRRFVLPLIASRTTVDALLGAKDAETARRVYDERWDSRRWRAMFEVAFSRRTISRITPDPAQLVHLREPPAKTLLARTRDALTRRPPRENPFVRWVLTAEPGALAEAHPGLSRDGHARLLEIAPRFSFVEGELEAFALSAPPQSYDRVHLSNLLDYVTPAHAEELLRRVARIVRPGGLVAWWSFLVPRPLPPTLSWAFTSLDAEALTLLTKDRAFLYGGFHLIRRTERSDR